MSGDSVAVTLSLPRSVAEAIFQVADSLPQGGDLFTERAEEGDVREDDRQGVGDRHVEADVATLQNVATVLDVLEAAVDRVRQLLIEGCRFGAHQSTSCSSVEPTSLIDSAASPSADTEGASEGTAGPRHTDADPPVSSGVPPATVAIVFSPTLARHIHQAMAEYERRGGRP